MEEKERYKWSQDVIIECAYEDYDYIVDTENNIIFDDDNYFKLIDLLNQKDKRIKELEQENEKLFAENHFKSCEYCQNKIVKENVVFKEESNKLFEENQQLKQQLHDLPKKIVEEIKGKQPNFTENSYGFTTKQGWDMCVEILATILKKYGVEDEINND